MAAYRTALFCYNLLSSTANNVLRLATTAMTLHVTALTLRNTHIFLSECSLGARCNAQHFTPAKKVKHSTLQVSAGSFEPKWEQLMYKTLKATQADKSPRVLVPTGLTYIHISDDAVMLALMYINA